MVDLLILSCLLLNQLALQVVHIIGAAVKIVEFIILCIDGRLGSLFFLAFLFSQVICIQGFNILQIMDILAKSVFEDGIRILKIWLMDGVHSTVACF